MTCCRGAAGQTTCTAAPATTRSSAGRRRQALRRPGADTLTGGRGRGPAVRGYRARPDPRSQRGPRPRRLWSGTRHGRSSTRATLAVRCEVVRRPAARQARQHHASDNASPPAARRGRPADCRLPTRSPSLGPTRGPARRSPADPPVDPPVDPPLRRRTTIRSCSRPVTSPTAPRAPSRPPRCSTTCPAPSRRSATPPIRTAAYEDFANCYHPTWGRHKARTRPAVGQPRVRHPGAVPYWNYFGDVRRRGRPGLVQLRPRRLAHRRPEQQLLRGRGGCFEGSPQLEWLRADLAANPSTVHRCVLAHPALQLGSEARQRPQHGALLAGPVRARRGARAERRTTITTSASRPRRRSATSTSRTASGSSSSAPAAASCAR